MSKPMLVTMLTLAVTAPALAQGPGSYAQFGQFGPGIEVDASFVASDGCQTVLSAGYGAPPGVAVPPQTAPATVVIGPDPAGCSGEQVLRRRFRMGGSQVSNLVEIFFVSVDGRLLKTEKISIANPF